MHLFHGNEHHVHVVYTERTTTYAFVRQTVCLGYTSGLIKQYNKTNFFRLEVWFLINQSINQSIDCLRYPIVGINLNYRKGQRQQTYLVLVFNRCAA